jgi:hypothetical protein
LTSEDNTLRWDEAPRPASEDSLGSSQSGPRRSGLDEKQIPSEVFARALKDAVNSGRLSTGGSATSWNAAGDLAGLSRRPSPPENPATSPAAGGPLQAQSPSRLAVDSSAILTGLGGLLARDPRVLQDALPVENSLSLAGFRDTRQDRDLNAAGGLSVGMVPPSPSDSLPSLDAALEVKGMTDPGLQGSSTIGQDRSLANELGVFGILSGPAQAPVGPEAGDSSSTPWSASRLGSQESLFGGRIADNVPLANPIADRMIFGSGSPEPEDRTPVTSPFIVNLDHSSIAAGPFGPAFAGTGGSSYGGLAPAQGVSAGGDDSILPPPSVEPASGQSAPTGVDPANSAAFDLSRTNEILQQLLDEIRRGHQTFLPNNDRNSVDY